MARRPGESSSDRGSRERRVRSRLRMGDGATRRSHFDLDVVAADANIEASDVLECWCGAHLAGGDLEPRTVPGTFDLVTCDGTFAERSALVRAGVVDGVDVPAQA